MDTLIGTVPENWQQAPLGDLCELKSGPSAALRGHVLTVGDSGVPVVTAKNLRFNTVSTHDLYRVARTVAAGLPDYRLAPGDIVCTRTGELGRQALIDDAQSGWLYGTACMRVRPRAEKLAPQFLLCYLGHPAVVAWLRRNDTGSAIPSMSARVLATLPVVVPPIHIQADIAETLRLLDAKAAVHDDIVRATVALRDSLLPALFMSPRAARATRSSGVPSTRPC